MQHHARWRSIWFCPIPGCPSSLSTKEGLVRHLTSRQHARGIEINLGRRVAMQIANQNCFWPVNQTMADKLLRASKRIIRYVALYSMAGVAMESRLFRIHPSARDTPFIDAKPDAKDGPEPSHAQWLQITPSCSPSKKPTRSPGKTKRVGLSGGRGNNQSRG